MDRTLFYNVDTSSGIEELDYLDNSISNFKPSYPVGYYRVQGEDLLRPDLISSKVYGTPAYWWLILAYNEVSDSVAGYEVGDLFKIPSLIDIYDFYRKNRRTT